MKGCWIGFAENELTKKPLDSDFFGRNAAYYRKKFNLTGTPVLAELKLSATGIFKAFINGKSVSDELFAPGWTNYDKRILYRKYDVTSMIGKGGNALSVCVGDGWYAGYISIKGRNVYGEDALSLFAELSVTFEDGKKLVVATDESWKTGEGAIRQNDILGGEVYDDSFPHEEISLFGFDDSGWQNAVIKRDKSALLTYCDYEPVRIRESFKPVLLRKKGGTYLFDFGQNFAGMVSIKARGEKGARIVIRHGEMLDNGELYVKNLRRAKATDTLILNGRETTYTPVMTYHGFRYAEISVTGNAELLCAEGKAAYNSLAETGGFETSSELVNKIFSCCVWGMKSNFVDIPTDCPQRNERLGWTGDAQVFSRSAMYLADCRRFYDKYLTSIDDDRCGGKIPDIVPYFGVAGFDRAFWRDAAVVIPFNLYEMYGEKKKALKYAPMIKDFLACQMQTAVGYVWDRCFYNDWLNIDENSPEDVLATCCNAYCFSLAIKLFDGLGLKTDEYSDFYRKIKQSFNEKFVNENGEIDGGTQTVYALAYRAGLINEACARNGLLKRFKKHENHIHSGFCGIRFILPVLCELGLAELAYGLICNDTFPSWGYSVKNGATTVWERWDAYVEGKGFGDETMNSFNHYSLGSCCEWFFEYVLGIRPLAAGFDGVKIQPFTDRSGKISFARGSYDSVKGKISVEWEKTEDGFYCKATKPRELNAEFVFDGVYKIVCDGKNVKAFDEHSAVTEIYFR